MAVASKAQILVPKYWQLFYFHCPIASQLHSAPVTADILVVLAYTYAFETLSTFVDMRKAGSVLPEYLAVAINVYDVFANVFGKLIVANPFPPDASLGNLAVPH